MMTYLMKTVLVTGVLFLVSACGTSQARVLVSDMKKASGEAELVVTQTQTNYDAYETQVQAALSSLYVAYVRQNWQERIDQVCASAKVSAYDTYRKAVNDAQAATKTELDSFGTKIFQASASFDDDLAKTKKAYTDLLALSKQYPDDLSQVNKTSRAESAYLATAIAGASMRANAILDGYDGISDSFNTFVTGADAFMTKEMASLDQACTAAKAQAQTAAVTPLNFGGKPSDGNSLKLLAQYAKSMGVASDALENYFNTNFSSGKNSFLGVLVKGAFDGLIHGSSTPVTGGQIKTQADSLIAGGVAWVKQAADGLVANVKGGMTSAKNSLVTTIAGKVNDEIKKYETKLLGAPASAATTAASGTK